MFSFTYIYKREKKRKKRKKSDISKKLKIDLFFQPQPHKEVTRLLSFLAFFIFFFLFTPAKP